jgi:hypothetical protein
LTLEHLDRVLERPVSWKWVVVGLHSAFHGAFCLVLRRSDGAQLLPKKQEQRVYASWERERETGQLEGLYFDHVDWFLELFKKTLDPQRMSYFGGSPLTPSEEQVKAVEKLNDFRSDLIHFSTTTRGFETLVFVDLLNVLLPVLLQLLFDRQPHVFLRDSHQEAAEHLTTEIAARVSVIQQALEPQPRSAVREQ